MLCEGKASKQIVTSQEKYERSKRNYPCSLFLSSCMQGLPCVSAAKHPSYVIDSILTTTVITGANLISQTLKLDEVSDQGVGLATLSSTHPTPENSILPPPDSQLLICFCGMAPLKNRLLCSLLVLNPALLHCSERSRDRHQRSTLFSKNKNGLTVQRCIRNLLV